MSSVKLSPEQWAKILDFLRGCAGLYVGQEAECQRFIEGVLWMSRSGAQWRLLPAEYGTLEQRVQAICPLGRPRHLETNASVLR